MDATSEILIFQIGECQRDISDKERQLGKLQDQEKALVYAFIEAIGDSKFKDFLLKVKPL